MFTSLPVLAETMLPNEPPLMFTTLPELASKKPPTVPPEILTSLPALASKNAPNEPPSLRFSWVLAPTEVGAGSEGMLMTVVNPAEFDCAVANELAVLIERLKHRK